MFHKGTAFMLAAAILIAGMTGGCTAVTSEAAQTQTEGAEQTQEQTGAPEQTAAAETPAAGAEASGDDITQTVSDIKSGGAGAGDVQEPAEDVQEPEEVPAGAPKNNGDTLVIALQQEVRSLDPARGGDQASNLVGSQIWDSLLAYDEEGVIVPELAASFATEDGITYVYQIRDDIVFSDGEPMTMEDVLFALNRHLEPELHSAYRDVYANVQEIKQTADWELTIKLRNPDPAWQHALTGGAGAVIEKAYCEEHEEAGDFGSQEAGVIGTGPYRFDHWNKGEELVLTRNTRYREKQEEGGVSEICFRILRDEVTLLTQLRSGDADLCISPPEETREDIRDYSYLRTETVPSQTCLLLVMNCRNEFFKDPKVREAVAKAVDADVLFEGILAQAGEPGISSVPFSPAQYGSQTKAWESYVNRMDKVSADPEAAAEALSESAHPDGFSCRLFYKGTPARNICAEYIDQALGEIGIEVDTEELTGPDMNNYQTGVSRDYDLLLVSWEAKYPDPAASLYPLLLSTEAGEGGTNCACYSNAEVDKLLTQQKASFDLEERTKLLQEALTAASQEYPMITFCYVDQYVIVNDRIDYTFTPRFIWDFPLEKVRVKAD